MLQRYTTPSHRSNIHHRPSRTCAGRHDWFRFWELRKPQCLHWLGSVGLWLLAYYKLPASYCRYIFALMQHVKGISHRSALLVTDFKGVAVEIRGNQNMIMRDYRYPVEANFLRFILMFLVKRFVKQNYVSGWPIDELNNRLSGYLYPFKETILLSLSVICMNLI